MFRPNFRAIFRLIFEQVECIFVNAFNLRDLQGFIIMVANLTRSRILKALSNIHSTCSKISLKMALNWAETCSWNYNLI